MSYVLVEPLGSKRTGTTLWFKQMTAIGPMTTPVESERAVFGSEEGARACPAMWHALSFFEVVDVGSETKAAAA